MCAGTDLNARTYRHKVKYACSNHYTRRDKVRQCNDSVTFAEEARQLDNIIVALDELHQTPLQHGGLLRC